MPKNVSFSFARAAEPLRKLTRFAVPVLFFITPLVFSPFTTEALEMNKQLVFCLAVFLAAVGLLGSTVAKRRVSLRGGWLVNLVPLVLLLAVLVSTILSIAGVESWLGYGGQEYLSFLTVATGVMLFYTLVNGSDTRLARNSLLALLLASSIVSLLTLLSLVSIHLLPFAFTHGAGFNTVGNINAFLAWIMPVTLAGIGFYLSDTDDGGSVIPDGAYGVFMRLLIGFMALTTTFFLIAVDFWALWAAFMLGLATLIFMSFLVPKHFPDMRRLLLPSVLFLMAVLFLFIKTPVRLSIPLVVSPDLNASWSITEQTLAQNPVRLLFGSGPGSFDLDYAQYRPVEVNNSPFWNVRFDRAQIHPLTILATTGLFGFAAWALFVIVVLSLGLGRIIRGREESEWKVNYSLLAGWMSLLALQLLSPFNMALTVLFWGLSGLLVSEAVSKTRDVEFSEAPRMALSVTAGFALFTVVGILTTFAILSRQGAEMAFAKAARMDAAGATPTELVDQMSKAVKMNPSNAVYQRNLATAYLAQAGLVVNEGVADEDFSTEDKQRLAQIADSSIKVASRAAELGPSDGVNWAINGLIYRELMPFIQNAHDYSATMYTKATELEPFNPAYQTDLARVYLAVADRAQAIQEMEDIDDETMATAVANEAENLRIAAEILNKAIELKADYAPAHYYLAATYERQGKLEDASKSLATLTKAQPNDAGLGFQLGVIYLKMEEVEKAEAEFERVLEVYPDYSNALWYLAAIKTDKGDIEEALTLLRRIERLNPENEVVKDSIANLEAGGSTVTVPDPIEADTMIDVVQP